jgi:predicted nucleic acid-binding protein
MALDKIYIDSCCFIEAIKHDVGKSDPSRDDDIWYTQKILEAAKNGDVEVFTSHLTITECRRAHDTGKPTDEVKRLIRSILMSGKVVRLAELTLSIAEKARDLHWEHDLNLGGADSIHVATALSLGCTELFTYDMKKKSPIAYTSELENLGVKPIKPSQTNLLPPKYNQLTIQNIKGV